MIQDQTTKVIYVGNGQTTHFPFKFKYNDKTHIHVAIYDIDTQVQTELTKDFFVDSEKNEVIYPGYQSGQEPPEAQIPPVLQANQKLVIYRQTPLTQEIDFGPKYPLPFVENGTDKNTMISQEMKEALERSVKVDMGSEVKPDELLTDIKQNVADANQSAQNAQQSADEAQEYAQNANANAQSINIRTFPNVESMKRANNLKTGGLIKTQGFYQPNDGGGADYVIVDDIGEDEADEASIITLQKGLYAKLLIKDFINVKQMGAKGDGITNDTEAIQKAINYAGKENSGIYKGKNKTVYIPAGVFIVNKPLNITANFSTVKGTENTINYDTQPNYQEVGGSVIKKGSDFVGANIFNITGFKCAFIYLNLICINDKTDTRNVEGFTVKSDRNLFLRCFVYGPTKAYNAKGTKECQWEFCVASYSLITGYAIGGDSRLVHCKANCTGIALSGTPGIMATVKPFTDIDDIYNVEGENYYLGASVVLRDGARNSNIIGGLYDWNRYGIICDNSDGLIVCGVRFHHNSNGNIVFRNSFGFDITGCRFLGGGFLNSRVLSAKDCIYISDTKKFTDWKYGNISGNCFRYGDWTAQEDTELNLENETAGPADNSIYVDCYSNLSLNVSANSMEKSAYYSVIKVNDKSDNYIVVNFSGNTWDKPLNTTNNKNSVLFNINGFLRIYGLPTVTPPAVLTINQVPTTKNSYTNDGYCWDEYKWIGSKWIGINQRKIPNYPNNPTNFPGGNSSNFGEADDGFMYYNTTLKRYIRYNGSQWIDTNTGEVIQ